MLAIFADKETIALIIELLQMVKMTKADLMAHTKLDIIKGDLEMALELPEGSTIEITNRGSSEGLRELQTSELINLEERKLNYTVVFGMKGGKIHKREVTGLYDCFLLGFAKHLPAGFFEFACYSKPGDYAHFIHNNMEVKLYVR